MLYDRDYMREPERRRIRASVALLWILGACYVVQTVLFLYGRVNLAATLGLGRDAVTSGHAWQFLTYQFLHDVPMPLHVLMNCLGIYFFGRTVEETVGTRRFLWLYLGGGIAGGLLQVGLDALLRPSAVIHVVGASAGVSALVAAFCRLDPQRPLTVWVLVFPVTLRSRVFLAGFAGLSALGAFLPWDNVAHAAHLGGIAVGYCGIAALEPDGWWARWRERRAGRVQEARIVSETPRAPRATAAREEAVATDVDPILDKIARHGIQSLTPAERRALEEAGRRMGPR